MKQTRILYIALELPYWSLARQWSYSAQLAFEEGFSENNVDCFTVTTIWLSRLKEICAGRQFDQVWIEVAHTEIDRSLLEWIAGLAPVRVGLIYESLEYSPEECDLNPNFKRMRSIVEKRLKYLTHVVAVDENDVERINRTTSVKAFWSPSTVPHRFILEDDCSNPMQVGAFMGSAYGQRAILLNSPQLKNLLVKQGSAESGTIYPYLFTILHVVSIVFIKSRLPGARRILPVYMKYLRKIRQKSFKLWLRAIQRSVAAVNLPSLVKTYPSRVIEGMAAGRPVISWEIPERPKNRGLFEDGREILLFTGTDAQGLASLIKKVIDDPGMADRIVVQARDKLMKYHTIEKRVGQILKWIETDEVPIFS